MSNYNFCPNCGTACGEGMFFCQNCGTKLFNNEKDMSAQPQSTKPILQEKQEIKKPVRKKQQPVSKQKKTYGNQKNAAQPAEQHRNSGVEYRGTKAAHQQSEQVAAGYKKIQSSKKTAALKMLLILAVAGIFSYSKISSIYAHNQYKKGMEYYVIENFTDALPYLQKAADKGNADAMLVLGHMYAGGYGVNKDYSQAKYWYQKAADKGNADAMVEIGNMYQSGEGVVKDSQKALQWCKKAEKIYLDRIEKGDLDAIGNLFTNLYTCEAGYDDVVLEPNEVTFNELGKKYIAHLNTEIDKGNADAMMMLANIYDTYATDASLGVFLNFIEDPNLKDSPLRVIDYCQTKIAQLYRKAAEAGNAAAMTRLGDIYSGGEGVPQDYSQAKYWYQKAADKGNEAAKNKLRDM